MSVALSLSGVERAFRDGARRVEVLRGVDLEVARAFVALPGCPGNWAACEAFDNTVNYGGAIYKPGKNPTEDSMSWG